MNKKEIEKIGDPEEHDWNAFFDKISIACPWSQKYWNQNKIEIVEWTGKILELSNDCVARVYKCPGAEYEEIREFVEKMDMARPKEKWFVSWPGGVLSNPVGSLIQQDRAFLTGIRNKYLHKEKNE